MGINQPIKPKSLPTKRELLVTTIQLPSDEARIASHNHPTLRLSLSPLFPSLSSVLPNRPTRRIRLPNPGPHGLTHPDPQPRHGAHKHQRDQQMHGHFLAFAQVPPPAPGFLGFGSAEQRWFVLASGFLLVRRLEGAVAVVVVDGSSGTVGKNGGDGDAGVVAFFEVDGILDRGGAGVVDAGPGFGGAGVAVEGAERVGGSGIVGIGFGVGGWGGEGGGRWVVMRVGDEGGLLGREVEIGGVSRADGLDGSSDG